MTRSTSFLPAGGAMQYLTGVLFFAVLVAATGSSLAQSVTRVAGTVRDASSREPLPFVNVYFEQTSTGGATTVEGAYEISTAEQVTGIVASSVGYLERRYPIVAGQAQVIEIDLAPAPIEVAQATVTVAKERYSKKDNPAVDLMREVIARKKQHGVGGKAYCSYERYEKVQVDLNNVDDDFRRLKLFNGLEFIWDNLDSADAGSKPYLPMLLRETASRVYSRAQPATEREYIFGSRSSKLDAAIDQSNLNQVINALYENVDIYDDEITLVQKQFISPLAPLAISFYRFYIVDTVVVEGQRATRLSFIPKNQATYGFTGDLYVATDGSYQVVGVKMGLFGEVNLNFVRTIHVEQQFRRIDSSFLRVRDRIVMDFALSERSMGFTGTKSVYYADYDFTPPANASVFDGIDRTITSLEAEYQSEAFWSTARMVPLNENERGIYHLVDTLATVPKFKQIQKISKVLLTGYVTVGKFDLGPYTSFVGFNNVEGFKPKIGGQTNPTFSKRLFLQGYAAYGVDDRTLKYAGFATYSFNDNYLKNPRHYVELGYAKDTRFPGYAQEAVSSNNIVSSFRWGILDKMLLSNTFKFSYVKEFKSLEYGLHYENAQTRPYGNLRFGYVAEDTPQRLESVNTSEVGGSIRFAPNQQYTQRGSTRNRIYNRYPIFSLRYAAGLEGVLGGAYAYHRIAASAFKRFDLSILGNTYVDVDAGTIIGRVPYILMHIPRANQTYAYQTDAYNLMNFLEFVGDQYVNVNLRHYFEGFFFNRIPLVQKAKLREVVTLKATFGSVREANDPNLHPELVQFPVDDQDRATTTVLSGKPYVEAGVGVMNIAKVLRVDLVQRLTYLDRPNLQHLLGTKGLGVRVQVAVGF